MRDLEIIGTLIVGLLGVLVPAIIAIWVQLRIVHRQFNSRFDEIQEAFKAQGKAEERKEQDARDAKRENTDG